ncbi:MAG TPA: DUF6036 family nucleotidyltransferase [Gemmataceae bacterium]|nr:DUF6036 family nucleotidyltransferase [Gemmataceae bacterium]
MPVQTHGLWGLVYGTPEIDPDTLAGAVESQAAATALDYRTRLLIRDSVQALRHYWGEQRTRDWLAGSPSGERIEAICAESFERPGFPTIRERLMDKTDPEKVQQLLRELGSRIHLRHRLRLAIGGSIALILPGYLERSTTDIDVVNELPAEIRSQHALLEDLRKRYGLELAHFQSHYLPSGWDNRLHYLDAYGDLQVYLVDVYDVFLSKLFSVRTKDLDDLRMLLPQLDKEILTRRLKETTASMLAAEGLRKRAEQNWYILYGESLPQ